MNRFYLIIIGVLVLIILLQRSCSGPSTVTEPGQVTVKTDTVYITKDSLIVRKVPRIIRDTTYLPGEIKYIPDTNYAVLKKQFQNLVKEHTAINIYADTLKLDSLGYVFVVDSVQFNELKNRIYNYKYTLPIVKETTTVVKNRNQVYVGGGIFTNTELNTVGAELNLSLKTKSDKVYYVNGMIIPNQGPFFGIGTQWKIKLKNK